MFLSSYSDDNFDSQSKHILIHSIYPSHHIWTFICISIYFLCSYFVRSFSCLCCVSPKQPFPAWYLKMYFDTFHRFLSPYFQILVSINIFSLLIFWLSVLCVPQVAISCPARELAMLTACPVPIALPLHYTKMIHHIGMYCATLQCNALHHLVI